MRTIAGFCMIAAWVLVVLAWIGIGQRRAWEATTDFLLTAIAGLLLALVFLELAT